MNETPKKKFKISDMPIMKDLIIKQLEEENKQIKEQIAKKDKDMVLLIKMLEDLLEENIKDIIRKWNKLPNWSIYPLHNNKEYSYKACGINPITIEYEEHDIPHGFNPNQINDIHKEKDKLIISYIDRNENKELKLPKSLFDALKEVIKPEIEYEKPNLRTLMFGEEKRCTNLMESVWNVLVESKEQGIYRSTQEIAEMVNHKRQSVQNHLNFFINKGWVEKKRSRYGLVDYDKF